MGVWVLHLDVVHHAVSQSLNGRRTSITRDFVYDIVKSLSNELEMGQCEKGGKVEIMGIDTSTKAHQATTLQFRLSPW